MGQTRRADLKRRRAAAVPDAGALTASFRTARSVLEQRWPSGAWDSRIKREWRVASNLWLDSFAAGVAIYGWRKVFCRRPAITRIVEGLFFQDAVE